jgi:hypothetical protein
MCMLLVATDSTTARRLLLEGDLYMYIYGYLSMYMQICYVYGVIYVCMYIYGYKYVHAHMLCVC